MQLIDLEPGVDARALNAAPGLPELLLTREGLLWRTGYWSAYRSRSFPVN